MKKKFLDLRVGRNFVVILSRLVMAKHFLYSPVNLISFDDVKRKRMWKGNRFES